MQQRDVTECLVCLINFLFVSEVNAHIIKCKGQDSMRYFLLPSVEMYEVLSLNRIKTRSIKLLIFFKRTNEHFIK